jgi:hypothetical protein
MDSTVFFTVLSGVLTYVAGELIIRLVVEPVQDMKRTIGAISHTLIERANVVHNPGVPAVEVMNQTSQEFRKLSSQLRSHLYLVPLYRHTAKVFRLPTHDQVTDTASELIGLSNSVHHARDNIYGINMKRVEKICDALGIYLEPGNRWPKDAK